MPLIADVLPAGVASAELTADQDDAVLYREELAVVERAVPKRRGEFVAGRSCARHALTQLGWPPGPIARGSQGEPMWPAGIVGSITHCAGYRAAAVARISHLLAVGIDAEPHRPLPGGVLPMISTPVEAQALAELHATGPATAWDRLLFSAKEAVYKAYFSLTHRRLGFKDARVTFQPQNGAFTVFVRPEPAVDWQAPTGLRGRWLVRDGLIVTAVTVPVSPGSLWS